MEKADVSNGTIKNYFLFHINAIYITTQIKKKKKIQIKTKTWEIPPTIHLHLLSLKSIILAHTTSIKNQDIFLLKKKNKIFLVQRLSTATLGCHLKKEGNLSRDLCTSILLWGKHLPINVWELNSRNEHQVYLPLKASKNLFHPLAQSYFRVQ